MVFDQAEQLKREYTDKFVVVDASRPELARFKGCVGQVRTVNMSGRALVEFPKFDNIGWYDIDPSFLKVVDRPPPPPPEAKAEKKAVAKASPEAKAAPAKTAPAAAAGEKKLSPLEMARMQGAAGSKPAAATAAPAAAPAPSGGKLSTADILAAARTKKGEPAATAAAPAAAPKPAPPAAAPTGKLDRSKLSVEEMLAMARGQTPGTVAPAATSAAPPAAKPAPPKAAPPAAEPAVQEAAPAPEPAEKPAAKPAAAAGGDRPKAGELSIEQILAWCRAHDAK